MATFAVPGPAVPGLAIPGDFTAGYPGGFTPSYQYIGLAAAYYLQYLGPGGTLYATPGEQFDVGSIAEASGWPYVLAVPPAGGAWLTGAGGPVYEVTRREPREDAAKALARGRAHNSALHAAWARGDMRPGTPLSPEDHRRLGCCTQED